MRATTCLLLVALAFLPRQAPRFEHIDAMGGYTQVVAVEDRGVKTIWVSGQVGSGSDFEEHADSAFAELARRLGQAGATPQDVVKVRAFVRGLDAERYESLTAAQRAAFEPRAWPATTVVGVQSLARAAFLIEIDAIAVVAAPGTELDIARMAPMSRAFSGVVTVTAHGMTTVYLSGQTAPGNDLDAQAGGAWERVARRLDDAGAGLADLVKVTTYVADLEPGRHLEALHSAYPAALADSDWKPAHTLVGVPDLPDRQAAVAIDAIAVIGAGSEIERRFLEPAGLYSQAVAVSAGGPTTVYLGGQVGTAAGPLATQADEIYSAITRRLAAVGAGPTDLAAVSVYIPSFDESALAALGPARSRHGFAGTYAPASTLLGVQSLGAPSARIEIDGIALVAR